MLRYVKNGSGVNGDFHGLGFCFGKIKGYFAVMPNFRIYVNLLNDCDLPKGMVERFLPLARELGIYADELVSRAVHRLEGEDYTKDSVTEALCFDVPEDGAEGLNLGKPTDVVKTHVQKFEDVLPSLGEQVRTYEQFLDHLEGPVVIGGKSARRHIDPETRSAFGDEFCNRLSKGIKGEDADLRYPNAVAAWKGVLLRRGYGMQRIDDPVIGKVEVFSA